MGRSAAMSTAIRRTLMKAPRRNGQAAAVASGQTESPRDPGRRELQPRRRADEPSAKVEQVVVHLLEGGLLLGHLVREQVPDRDQAGEAPLVLHREMADVTAGHQRRAVVDA